MSAMPKISGTLMKLKHKYCSAVVVAAGAAERMGRDKLALELGGMPVLLRSLLCLENCAEVDEIIVVTRPESMASVSRMCKNGGVTKASKVVCGGATRTQSALAGACAVNRRAKIICIHDAARPFASSALITAVVRAAADYQSAAPAVPVKDTIRIVRDGQSAETPDRERVFAMQTPQAFDADIIKAALTAAVRSGQSYTDDCAACEAIGVPTHLTSGDEDNIKLTTPLDIPLAEAIAAKRSAGE